MENDIVKKAVITNRVYMTYTTELLLNVAEHLTYKLQNPRPGAKPIIVKTFNRVNDNILSLPVGRLDLIPDDYVIIDKRINIEIPFPRLKEHVVLRESQQLIYDQLDDNWIINAKPGYGKTFTALAIASKLKRKTIVVVHTVKLREQWENEIRSVYGIEPGIIGSNKYNINAPIVVANVQTLVKRIKELENEFGLLVMDEAHHSPASIFKKVVDVSRARYKIGLSGTMRRRDMKHMLIPDYFSKNIYVPKTENVMQPTILVYKSGIELPGNHLTPWANRVTELYDNPEFRKVIKGFAMTQAERGHTTIVVGDRVKFLHEMSEDTPDSVCVTGSVENQHIIEQDLRDGIHKILWASVGIYKEGVSINELSCMILASVIANEALIIQLLGRIIRKMEGKMTPELVDIVLAGRTGENQFAVRLRAYHEEGYTVKYLN